jgi:hypothetical protein
MDFDPRDSDSSDDERLSPRDFYKTRHREVDARSMGRGPGNSRDSDNDDRYDSRDRARWPDRERDSRERSLNAREPFTRDLDLPRGPAGADPRGARFAAVISWFKVATAFFGYRLGGTRGLTSTGLGGNGSDRATGRREDRTCSI